LLVGSATSGDERVERYPDDRAEPERLGDGERPVDEHRVRGDECEVDSILSELAEGDHCLESCDTPAGDHNAEFLFSCHVPSVRSRRPGDIGLDADLGCG
jgi:hypothetical protein